VFFNKKLDITSEKTLYLSSDPVDPKGRDPAAAIWKDAKGCGKSKKERKKESWTHITRD